MATASHHQMADNFSYTDPVDGSRATRQGIRVLFADGSRWRRRACSDT